MYARIDRQVLKVAGLVIAAVGIGVFVGRPPPTRPAPAALASSPGVIEDAFDVIVVHVSGEVATPGLVEVQSDARVADAIAAAGGVTLRADLLAVNLAGSVADGQQIVVPSSRQHAQATPEAGTDVRIRINAADAAALEALPGVGPVLAGEIIAHRAEYGPFRQVEDLLDVPGIGEQKLGSLRDRVIVP